MGRQVTFPGQSEGNLREQNKVLLGRLAIRAGPMQEYESHFPELVRYEDRCPSGGSGNSII